MSDRTPSTGSGGTTPFDNPLTPDERLAEVLRDRKLLKATDDRKGPPAPRGDRGWIDGAPATSTYFAEAGLADDEIGGGRFAPKRGPDPWPRLPPDSPWSGDPVPIEPPYADRVDWLPDQITVSGEDQRGLVPWEYGPSPTERHSSYPTDTDESVRPNTEVLCSLASSVSPETATLSIAGAVSGLPSLTAHLPSHQPQLEPPNEPTTEET
jgi:hypothetical protein